MRWPCFYVIIYHQNDDVDPNYEGDAMKKLFLIGFMGTGKSAVGRVLAKRQGYTCDDLDELIERSTGTTIADYIDSHGEEAFRDAETKMLTDWIDLHSGTAEDNEHKYSVLACGGGVVLREENRKMMRANGMSVRLTASIQSIYQRVSANAPERPLLISDKPLPERLETLAAVREPLYRETADIEVSSEGKSAAQTADLICQALETPLSQDTP